MPVDHVNGAGLYWERGGSGPRLLFCNGSGTTLQAVRPVLDLLAGQFDLLAWDYRGLGRSVPLPGPYAMADLAADAAGLLEIAGWDACRVLGVSFGGMVAQEFAVTRPDQVERLALACTSPGGGGGSSYPLQDLQGLPPGQRAAAQLTLADSRWDERWLQAHPADRALAGRLAANQDQQDPAAAAREAQLAARSSAVKPSGSVLALSAGIPALPSGVRPGMMPAIYRKARPGDTGDASRILTRSRAGPGVMSGGAVQAEEAAGR